MAGDRTLEIDTGTFGSHIRPKCPLDRNGEEEAARE